MQVTLKMYVKQHVPSSPKRNLMKNKHVFLIGAHMSIAGGIKNALLAGESIGCTCIQFFTHNNRQWAFPALTDEEIAQFKTIRKESSIQSLMVHASYLLNIGSPNPDLRTKSTKTLIKELNRCALLDVPYLIIHPGAAGDASQKDCLLHIIDQLNLALDHDNGSTMILIENTAGQGSSVGSSFEQITFIINGISNKKRIGVCFDTCHAFAAGYDLRTQESYTRLWELFEQFIGIQYLKAIHLNDSKKDLNSHVDRHEHIGQGKMGLEPFALICNDERFFDIPKVIETPKDHSLQQDLNNILILKGLLSPSNKNLFLKNTYP